MNKTKVLLIDDEKGVTLIMKMNLERTGDYEVETENDSFKAFDTALAFRPDIIILDMVMPGKDGGDVKRQIEESPDLKNIPILFLSALVSKNDTSADADVVITGDDIMIPKPARTELIIKCIEERLGSSA